MQRHHRILSDDEFLQLLKGHVDHGFDLIRNDTDGFKSEDDYVDYLVELTRTGLEQRTQEAAPTIEATPAFGGLIDLQIGWNAETDAAVSVEFNRQTNNYLAVTGKPGSGKTQFVKDLLAQIRRQSEYQVNFIFFDYAKGDVADDANFVAATRAEVVRLPEESLPVDPFSRVNVNSETAVKVAAQEFAAFVRDVEKRLGTIQAQLLYDAILRGFEVRRGENPPFPDFQIFASARETDAWANLTDKTVIIDLHGLTVLRELTVCLVLTSLYRELMAMPDSNVADGVREMRTIIVIDEAHHFLKDKRRNAILERLIREIRSKGASVFLMSQSPDDYDSDDFDFAEMLEFIYILQSNANATKFLQKALGISATEAKKISAEMNNLETAHAFEKSYDAESKSGAKRLRVRQFWREKGQ